MQRITFAALLLLIGSSAFGASKRPPITGIEYVQVYAADPAASQDFYTKRLAAPEVPCLHATCQQYQIGEDQHVEVVKANGHATGMDVIAFRTTDAGALREFLAGHGIQVPPATRKNADGSLEFEVSDPEGHHIAFLQPAKSGTQQSELSHRIIHVGFIAKNRAVMDGFYRDLLGFRLYWHGGMKDDETNWVAMQVPNGRDWLEYMLKVDPQADHREIGVMNHFSLGTQDINAAQAGLEKSGWKSSQEEHKQMGRDGKWQLNIFDPDDVRVEFMEFKPANKPCCSEFTAPHPEP